MIQLTPKSNTGNDRNYENRKHAKHTRMASKEECLQGCVDDTECAMVVYSTPLCFFYNQFFELENSTLEATAMYNEIKGAVAYNNVTKECYLYKNQPGQSYSENEEFGN